MSISQRKYDLAVLFKMFEDAENGGGWVTRHNIQQMFSITIPMRRIEAATEKLLEDEEVVKDFFDPVYMEESLWQLSRSGIEVVERALKIPNSFIARLSSNGDTWLESEEAEKAVLNKRTSRATNADSDTTLLAESAKSAPERSETTPPNISITNTFAPENKANFKSSSADASSGASWANAIIALVIGAATIAAMLWIAGKV